MKVKGGVQRKEREVDRGEDGIKVSVMAESKAGLQVLSVSSSVVN